MLKIENLTTSFGSVIALDGVSMTAQESKITTVIGANGAGKSTLLRTISGLESPSTGSISWEGQSIVGRKPEDIVRAGIAHVPEGHAVISELSVEEGLAPLVVEQIIDCVNTLCRSTGLTVLLVEQNANTALGVADHGVLLALGKVVADRPAAELKADSSLRAAYLGY